jgi:hypothetical protein
MSTDFTMSDLFRSLDERKRPEDVARMILALGGDNLSNTIHRKLRAITKHPAYSWMSQDFHREMASVEKQMGVAAQLFAVAGVDPADESAVLAYLHKIEATIGKTFGKNDYKHDRLNAQQREKAGITISRRQYNKRFRLTAKMEDKTARRNVAMIKRGLTLASKSRLASHLTEEAFCEDPMTAYFIAYYTARCNARSLFTVGSQARPYDEVCESMMNVLRKSDTTNWMAIAHVMPDEEVVNHLTDHNKGLLMGLYYDMLLKAAKFLKELWDTNDFNAKTMIVKRGNDSSTWNLCAGAWNKLRDGWFAICHALKADDILEQQCFGKVMRLMAADVAAWHRMVGEKTHDDTSVWAALPPPWEVLVDGRPCTREQVKKVCDKYGIDADKKGWIARHGKKKIEKFVPTPELVHGVVIGCPAMAKAMHKCGIFSGKLIKLRKADVNLDDLIQATEEGRADHFYKETSKKLAASKK